MAPGRARRVDGREALALLLRHEERRCRSSSAARRCASRRSRRATGPTTFSTTYAEDVGVDSRRRTSRRAASRTAASRASRSHVPMGSVLSAKYQSIEAGRIGTGPRGSPPPYEMPAVCVSRSRIVIGRRAGDDRDRAPRRRIGRRRGTTTVVVLNAGMNADRIVEEDAPLLDEHHDRDARDRLRSSTRCGRCVSVCIGTFFSMSARPAASK